MRHKIHTHLLLAVTLVLTGVLSGKAQVDMGAAAGSAKVSAVEPALPGNEKVKASAELKAFQQSLSSEAITPEERIARTDQWMAEHGHRLAEVRKSSFQEERTPRVPATGTDEASILRLRLASEVKAIDQQKLTPEERIRRVDALLAEKSADLQRLKTLESQKRSEEAALRPTRPLTPPITEKDKLVRALKETMREINSLSPEERIAEVDRKLPELEQMMKAISQRETTKPNSENP